MTNEMDGTEPTRPMLSQGLPVDPEIRIDQLLEGAVDDSATEEFG